MGSMSLNNKKKRIEETAGGEGLPMSLPLSISNKYSSHRKKKATSIVQYDYYI
jgi:hypothetical protein